MDFADHIERVAQSRPGLRWRDALAAALAVTGVAAPGLFMTVRMRLKGAPLSTGEWIAVGVGLLAPAMIFLAGFALWRLGGRRKRPAAVRPIILDGV